MALLQQCLLLLGDVFVKWPCTGVSAEGGHPRGGGHAGSEAGRPEVEAHRNLGVCCGPCCR
jgi:hypothetical protein